MTQWHKKDTKLTKPKKVVELKMSLIRFILNIHLKVGQYIFKI